MLYFFFFGRKNEGVQDEKAVVVGNVHANSCFNFPLTLLTQPVHAADDVKTQEVCSHE